MAVSYLAWLNIISLAVRLLNSPLPDEGIIVKVFSENTTAIKLSDSQTKIYHIELYSKASGVKLKGYILIPRQDIFVSEDTDRFLFPFVPNAVFLTVNEFAVIYEEALQEPAIPKSKTLLPYVNKVQRILGVEQNNKAVGHRDNYSTSDGIQIIQLQEFPQFVELQVAKSGSVSLNYSLIKKMFPHKMILLSVVPDTGKVLQSWLKGGDVNFTSAFFKFQDEGTALLTTFLNEPEPLSSERINRLKHEIKDSMIRKQAFDQETYDFYDGFINRILLYDDEPETFSGYQPKQTPDDVLNFNPQIAGEINNLPSAEPENLQKLANLFKRYKKSAKKNKGKWIEGNLILGGNPKEYKPTDDELILGEIGSRIIISLKKNAENKWQKLRKQQKLGNKKIEFTRFSFIHYDVMGSGRFFYVDTMEKIIIQWNKKEFRIENERKE